jgi:Zn-dependent M28 family amino/carboxypeptidase
MKFNVLHLSCLIAFALPGWGIAQLTPHVVKDPNDIRQTSRSGGATGTGDKNFKAAGDRLLASGELTERLLPDAEAIKRYAATITAADLEAHLRFIASDELEGRETGTRGQKLAARYLSTQFQKMGLQPGNKGEWYQTYALNRLLVKDASISLTGKDALKVLEGFVCFNKTSMAANLDLDYAFAGFGIQDKNYDNLQGLDLKGKMAVVLAGEPMRDGKSVISGTDKPSEWGDDMDLKLAALSKKGAKGAVMIVDDATFKKWSTSPWLKHSLGSASLRLAYKDEKEAQLPAFFVSETSANVLLKKAKTTAAAQRLALSNSAEIGTVDLSKARFTLTTDAVSEVVQAENVLGFIEGTDKKEEVVILTAHYDHLGVHDGEIFNGADDDGTGTVAILEVAEAFMAAVNAGQRPRRSILFMPVSGEEKGLLGSEYYSDHPVYPLKNTVCDLNIDMIGRVDEKHTGEPQYIYVIGSDKLSTDLHIANEGANKLVSNLELDYTFNSPEDPNRFYYRSDHYNFAKHGIPVIFYFSGVHEDYHKSTDDIEKILFPRAARVAQLVFATAWEVANRDEKLVVNKKNDFGER